MSKVRPFALSKAPYWQLIHMRKGRLFVQKDALNKRAYWICSILGGLGILSLPISGSILNEFGGSFLTFSFLLLSLAFSSTLIFLNFFKSGYTMKKSTN